MEINKLGKGSEETVQKIKQEDRRESAFHLPKPHEPNPPVPSNEGVAHSTLNNQIETSTKG